MGEINNINEYRPPMTKDIDLRLNDFELEFADEYDRITVEYINPETNERKVGYNAIAMGETLDIVLDSPEELINMLKLIDKIVSIYKKEGYKGEFYPKKWMIGEHKNDLAVDNRPTDILDTVFLSQESLAKTLNESENDLLNTHMGDLATFLNKIV